MDKLKEIYEEYGFVGINKLSQIAKKSGLKYSAKQILEFIQSQKVSQLHKKQTIKSSNIIRTTGVNVIYQIDLLDMTKFYKTNQGFKWILICIDIFTRKADALPMKNKTAETTLTALKIIFEKMGEPQICASDNGSEFKGVVAGYLRNNSIIQKMSEVGDHNSLGIVDRFSQTIKNILYRSMTRRETTVWYDRLQQYINAYNNTDHTNLDDMTPNEAQKYPSDTLKVQDDRIMQQPANKTLKIGDIVRVKLKKSVFEKGYTRRYSINTHKIINKKGENYFISATEYYRYNDLQLVPIEDVEIRVDEVKKAHRENKIAMDLQTDGIEEINTRRGLRERQPTNRVVHAKYGKILW